MNQKEQTYPTIEQVTERIKHMLLVEELEDITDELLSPDTSNQARALKLFNKFTMDLAEIQTFDELMEELQELGHDPTSAAIYIVGTFDLPAATATTLKNTLALIPDRGWQQ